MRSTFRTSCGSRFSAQLEDVSIGRVLLLALEQPEGFAPRGLRAATVAAFWDKAVLDACRVILGLDTLYASGERHIPAPPKKPKVEPRRSPDAVTSANGRRVGRSFGCDR